jgi:peptide/nickel transport system substrate-binding protein
VAVIAIIVIIALVAGVYYATLPGPSPTPKRVLRALPGAWPTYIDPAVAVDWSSSRVMPNLYDPLVHPSLEGPKPCLAESWETSADAKTWTFHLRHGVKFHDGSELTAEDVVFSMDRLLTIGEGYAFEFEPYVENVTALDKYTVQFKMKKPYGPFLDAVTLFFVANKDVIMAHIKKPGLYGDYGDYAKDWLLTHDAGSGAYVVKEYSLEKELVMEMFKDYWGKFAPKAPEEVHFMPNPGPAAVRTMMVKRELEIGGELPKEVVEYLATVKGINPGALFFGDQVTLTINTKKPPTDDVHLRRAMCWAFDYEQGAKTFYGASPSVGPISKEIPGCDPNVFHYTRNLTKAVEELKQSKYYDTLDQYEVEVHWCAEVADEEKVALLLVNCMAEVGIKAKIVKTPWLSIVEEVAKQETSPNVVCFLPCTTYGEAGSILKVKFHSEAAGTCYAANWLLNDTIDAMIDQAMATSNRTERFKIYSELTEELQNLATEVNVCDMPMMHPYQDYYVDWPIMEGKSPPDLAYNFELRSMQVYPEKREELLGG